MDEFVYKITKNISINEISFKLNYDSYPPVSYEDDIDPCSKLKTVDKLLSRLCKLIMICRENFNHT